jgi:hypothetical protein
MRITGVAMMMMVAATSARVSAAPVEERQLTVCMETVPSNTAIQHQARVVASGIFGAIGVKIRWRGSCNCPTEAIYVSLSKGSPAGVHADTLAYSMPYEGRHIVVLFDRVSHTDPSISGRLLGYTLAHEVTHILESATRHSKSGIMKAHWGFEDQYQIGKGQLGFAAEDVDLIYEGLEQRQLRLAAVASASRME